MIIIDDMVAAMAKRLAGGLNVTGSILAQNKYFAYSSLFRAVCVCEC